MASAGTATWLAAVPLAPAPLAAPAAALLAGGLVLVLPRLGWLTLIAAAAAAAGAQGNPGVAVVIAIALLLPVVLNLLRPTLWPLPVGAPALGLISLAGAWPAVAGRAATPWRRAALGAAGWVLMLLAAPLAGRGLYLPLAEHSPAVSGWGDSLYSTVHGLLIPLLKSGALVVAPLWGAAALVLPWMVRGRSLVFDLVAAVVWSAVLVSATQAMLIAAAPGGHSAARPSSATMGAVAAVVVALVPAALSAWRNQGSPGAGSKPGFP
jgi:hypothetical protein